MIKNIDGITFEIKSDFDFDWLSKYGKVFCVFDEQDSGNICFGVGKVFIKLAGVSTREYNGDLSEAIQRLKAAVPVYRDIKHPNLVKLLDHYEINGAYALVFEWVAGECLHEHWNFGKYPKYTHPESPNYKFNNLELKHKLGCLDTIYSLHEEVARCGYVTIDFYDGSIMYDFDKHKTTICDIDFYAKTPYVNAMGRMWGSSRLMAPEEFELGANIDEITNVFTMGAVAFELLGSNRERILEKWTASISLFNVAKIATNPERELRYQKISDFYKAWKDALI